LPKDATKSMMFPKNNDDKYPTLNTNAATSGLTASWIIDLQDNINAAFSVPSVGDEAICWPPDLRH